MRGQVPFFALLDFAIDDRHFIGANQCERWLLILGSRRDFSNSTAQEYAIRANIYLSPPSGALLVVKLPGPDWDRDRN